MKNIKLFDINGLDEDKLLKPKGDIIHFFVSSAKYKYDEILVKILEVYKEFLTLNCGFVSAKTTGDVQLPRGIKIPNDEVLGQIHDKIQEVIKSGNLLDLLPMFSLIYEG